MKKKIFQAAQESPLSKVLHSHKKSLDGILDFVRTEEGETASFKRVGLVGFYSIAGGKHAVELVRDGKRSIVRICGPGDLVGFGAWLSPYVSERYHLRCLEAGEIHFMPRQAFERLSPEIPELSSIVISALCKIIILKDQRISALENSSVKDRVKALLKSLGLKFGQDIPQGRIIDLKIDRPTLATMAATSPESFSRAISELEDDGLLARKRRKIIIKGPWID